MAGRHRSGHKWRTNRARLAAQRDGCWICREFGRDPAIDYALPARDPRAFEADHLVPLARGGTDELDNLAASHRACNEWRSDRTVPEVIELARRSRLSAACAATVETTTDW